MAETRPTGEQLRFMSAATGEHILDAYLEAAEKGGRTVPDMLADIYDATTGLFRTDLFEFRVATDQKLQFRVGDFADTTTGWRDVEGNPFLFFRPMGTWAASTQYAITDIVTYQNATYYALSAHTSTSTFDPTKWSLILDDTALNTATASAQASASTATTQATAAAASASTATTQASNAATSASAAAASASTATTQASNASTSASNAATSASAAAASASDAATSASNAAASYDSFDDRYLGSKTTNPTVDNDGNALLTGALYWNSSLSEMRVYTGSGWNSLGSGGGGGGGASILDDLTDVTITSPATGDLLRYNGTIFVNYPGSNFAAAAHAHAISDITNLQTSLDAKLDDSQATAFGLSLLDDADAAAARTTLGLGTAALEGAGYFATATHSHAISDVTNLQTSLDAKQPAEGYLAVTSSATPVTLTASSPRLIYITGSIAQTITLPDVSTLGLGWTFTIINASTQTVTVRSSDNTNFTTTQTTGINASYTCIQTTGTGTSSWQQRFIGANTRSGYGSLIYSSGPTITDMSHGTPTSVTAGADSQDSVTLTNVGFHLITSTPDNPSAVTLGANTIGRRVLVVNAGTNPLKVYPATGSQIDALGTNAAITIPVGGEIFFFGHSTTQWYSFVALSDGDKGDITVSAQGATWTIDAGAVTTTKLGGDITTAGKDLLDDADAAAQRSTLGLVIGTNVQAYDAELAAIAGLASAADRLPYFTGSGTAALATFTAAGRALVDDADAAAQRTTLGLGALSTASSVALGSQVSGTLPVANGGTGVTSSTGTGSTVLSASPALTGTPTAPSAAAYTETTQIATTEQVYDTVTTVPENAQTGTSYTLVLADAGKMVTLNNAAAITLTIPTNASVAFPVDTRIDILQYGAGQVTVGGAGVTIRSSGSKLKLAGQYSGATLWKKDTNEWVLIGDIVT